jgi:hypothetical protein
MLSTSFVRLQLAVYELLYAEAGLLCRILHSSLK